VPIQDRPSGRVLSRWLCRVASRAVLIGVGALVGLVVGLGFGAERAGAEPPRLGPGEDRADLFEWARPFDADPSIPSPASFFGRETGSVFTRYEELVAYCRALAAASPKVTLTPYGHSHQRRELFILTISSEANLADLDGILERNRALTNGTATPAAATLERNPTISWLSFGVHGNEPSVYETAMEVAYTLAASRHPDIASILNNSVIVIDPALNPDGWMRYVNWYENQVGQEADPNPDSNEHWEPWPGGRTNHYLFDLNRDWIWLTQPESRSRLGIYRRYMPHLHIDYHEMGYTSPYFFGEGDQPYNANIPESTRVWIKKVGAANAEAFDREGLIFATAERFDYMYPGYGKVLPVYHGAVGLLTEKGGHSRAGLAIEFNEHEVLTLRRRAYWHYVTAMSSLEMVARERRGMLERFHEYFRSTHELARRSPASFVIPADTDPALLAIIHDLCVSHGIRIDTLTRDLDVVGRRYEPSPDNERMTVARGSWLVRTDQDMGRLARVLFEADPELVEKQTYDITSWSLPAALGIEAVAVQTPIGSGFEELTGWRVPEAMVTGEGSVALIVDAAQHRFPAAVGAAIRHDVFARRSGEAIELDGKRFGRGSLIIHTLRNRHVDMDALVRDILASGNSVHRASTGMPTEGPALGNNASGRLGNPRVALLRGSPLNANSYGFHWHLLDVVAGIPHSVLPIDRVASADLSRFGVMVLPSGGALPSSAKSAIERFVRDGGVLVATGRSGHWASREILGLEAKKRARDDTRSKLSDLSFAERRDRADEDRVPGAGVRMHLDTTHPLTAGLGEKLTVIKTDADPLPIGDSGFAVASYTRGVRVGGWISERNIGHIRDEPAVTAHRLGRGWVIAFADDPTSRGFQHAPMRLLLNAIVFGPGL